MSEGPQEIHHAGHGVARDVLLGPEILDFEKRHLTGQAHSEGLAGVGAWVMGREREQRAQGIWAVLGGGV